jgi:hypothetical protein
MIFDSDDGKEKNDQLAMGEIHEQRNQAAPNDEVRESAAAPSWNGEDWEAGAKVTRYGRVVKPPSWQKGYDC